MDTTQMGMVILAPYSRQVPRNSISIHFLSRGLRGVKKKNHTFNKWLHGYLLMAIVIYSSIPPDRFGRG